MSFDNTTVCYKCKSGVSVLVNNKVDFSSYCPKCDCSLHVCKNCKHFAIDAYNQCRESSADRIVEKEKRNTCEYFSFKTDGSNAKQKDDNTKSKLDDLFK